MTAKIFRNAFLIGFTVLLACILLFFFIMYSNYQAQAFDNLAIEAEHISEGMQICGGESYLSAVQSGERITWIAADGSVLYDNMADSSTMENHLQRPEVAEAFETGSGRSDRYSSTILEKKQLLCSSAEGRDSPACGRKADEPCGHGADAGAAVFVDRRARAGPVRPACYAAGAADRPAHQRHQSR